MADVPSEIYRQILVRLPAESLFPLRSVCKEWVHIIDNPSFIKAHSNNQLYNHTLLVRNETGAPLYSLSLDSLNFMKGPQKIEATRIKQLIRPGVPRLRDLCMSQVACCNGLLLLSHENINKIWAIWNPLTGECLQLSHPRAFSNSYNYAYGFGFDNDADDYKVVRIDTVCSAQTDVVFQTFVYSMRLGSWSMIKDSPRYCVMQHLGAFFNEKMYWNSTDSIHTLDLRTEIYSQLPRPIDVGSNFHGVGHLDALDGCLIFSRYYQDQFDGWVMNDNGVVKSWIKLFSISCSLFDVGWQLKLIVFLKSKRQVVLQHKFRFWWFDVDSDSVLKFSIHGFPRINSSQICSGSLVRGFGDVTATKASTKKRKRNSEKTDSRLKICVRDVGEMCCSDNHFCNEDMCEHYCEEERYQNMLWKRNFFSSCIGR